MTEKREKLAAAQPYVPPMTDTGSPVLDAYFQEHRMPVASRPHDPYQGTGYGDYGVDHADSMTGEQFFSDYLSSLHGPHLVSPVPSLEQREGKHGDVRLDLRGRPVEFEVKLERKGASTGRHALEFGEYNTDHRGQVQSDRAPGWFRATKADVVVPIVPLDDGTLVMYPYHVRELRDHLRKMAQEAHLRGDHMLDKSGHLDHERMLDVLSGIIPDSRHTLGPVNHLSQGRFKRSRSLCLPYSYLVKEGLARPYHVDFV
ncbi:MAG: hypothetical protein JSS66_07065 [Armatimonadetes bacterium]|nr:hypothetical protein [Armatimonadota bacterium]